MKKIFITFGAAALLASCAEENEPAAPLTEPRTFRVSTEETRVHLVQNGGAIQTVWTKGDAVSVFEATIDNQKFNYEGEENVGGLLVAENANPMLSDPLYMNTTLAAYPYNENASAEFTDQGDCIGVHLYAPEVQHYRPGSFGIGANMMISWEWDGVGTLHFQNLCSYLGLRVKGNTTISKITLTRNDGGYLNGSFFGYYLPDENGDFFPDTKGTPHGKYTPGDGTSTLTLDCGEGVTLDRFESTEFIFAIPVDTEDNFVSLGTITVKLYDTDGNVMTQTTSKEITVTRNILHYMAPLVFKVSQNLPEGTYEIGDHYDKDGLEGIVGWVDASGQHGLLISLDETGNLVWGTTDSQELNFDAPNREDGEKNMEAYRAWAQIPEHIPENEYYESFVWCDNHGTEWYLPAVDEWKSVLGNNQRDWLNAAIAEIPGAMPFKYPYYWTSTEAPAPNLEISDINAYRFHVDSGTVSIYDKCNEDYTDTGVRAFAKF